MDHVVFVGWRGPATDLGFPHHNVVRGVFVPMTSFEVQRRLFRLLVRVNMFQDNELQVSSGLPAEGDPRLAWTHAPAAARLPGYGGRRRSPKVSNSYENRMDTFGSLVCGNRVRGGRIARDAGLVLAGSVFVAICAKIQIPASPVPWTLQTFGVTLVGATLGSRRGAAAMAAYLLEGAAGLPVFALPISGIGYFAGPTAGYLLAFPLAAFVVGALAERGWDRRFGLAIVALSIGNAIILALGFLWLALYSKEETAAGVSLSLLGWDALKILLTAAALPAGWRVVRRFERSREDGS